MRYLNWPNWNTKRREIPTNGLVGALRHDNRPEISRLQPTAHERHGREQRSVIALKLIIGYLNCRPRKIVVQ